jgi:hypothetical protein
MYWSAAYVDNPEGIGQIAAGTRNALCTHCGKSSIWLEFTNNTGIMIFPDNSHKAPLPHEDMPEDIKAEYAEARSISNKSTRGAAALLRLAIQKLCKALGEPGKNINDDIGALVKKGLPLQVQQALDIVRVTGNNAVHPGEMQLEEDPLIVNSLFELVNIIVENQITQPKKVNSLYERLPSGALEGIQRRDKCGS